MFGARGAPGNTINHRTSYWVAKHSPRVFVEAVDFVSGVGYDRAVGVSAGSTTCTAWSPTSPCSTSAAPDHAMRLVVGTHPGSTVDEVQAADRVPARHRRDVTMTREPTDEELRLLREVIDPKGFRDKEVPA